ncbi:MAG: hypothetical protein KAJ62_06800 [Desulfobacteraceae bacterium]|nr:hypothetical protein [Desulfobacteraceae bacterium]
MEYTKEFNQDRSEVIATFNDDNVFREGKRNKVKKSFFQRIYSAISIQSKSRN